MSATYPFVNAKDYGVIGDGMTDDRTALQAAIDTGRWVFVPQGTYRISGPLTFSKDNGGFIGEGAGTVIAPSYTSGDVFVVNKNNSEISGLAFRDFQVWPSVVMTSGYAFNCTMVSNSTWNGVLLGSIDKYMASGPGHRLYDGIRFNMFAQCAWEGGEIVVGHDAVVINGGVNQAFGAELSFDGGLRIYKPSRYGVHIGGSSGGVYFARMDVSECGHDAIRISDTISGYYNREVFLGDACTIDSNNGWGVNIQPNGLALLRGTGAWICNNGLTPDPDNGAMRGGLLVFPENAGSGVPLEVHLSGCYIHANRQDGIRLTHGVVNVSGCMISNNGLPRPDYNSGGHGIVINNPAVNHCAITGNIISNNGNATRGNGIAIIHGGVDNFCITDNNLFSNAQGNIGNSATVGLTRIIRNNLGSVAENSGYATLSPGESSVIVNHGLYDHPTSVQVWWGSAPENGTILFAAPATFTSTQFVVQLTGTATQTRAIGWRAVRGPN